jgi:ATP-dependent Zn protease
MVRAQLEQLANEAAIVAAVRGQKSIDMSAFEDALARVRTGV